MYIQKENENNRLPPKVTPIRLLVFTILLSLFCSLLCAYPSRASVTSPPVFEPNPVNYAFSGRYDKVENSARYNLHTFSFTSQYPVFGVYTVYPSDPDYNMLELYSLSNEGTVCTVRYLIDSGDITNYQSKCASYLLSDDSFYWESSNSSPGIQQHRIIDLSYFEASPSIMLFDSLESLQNYVASGDFSGLIRGEPNYDSDHDFSKDTYDPNIATPELSNISHDGFTINNIGTDNYIDIYVESTYYGLKHTGHFDNITGLVSGGNSYGFAVDKSWVYSTHRYNLTVSDLAINSSDISLSETYNCTNLADLVTDFQNWTDDYNGHRNLPDYSFFSHNALYYTTTYENHRYTVASSESDEEQLKKTGQAETKYYVRFYQYDETTGMKYGKWVAYTYSTTPTTTTDGKTVQENVYTGGVTSGTNGRPTITNPYGGTQDANGNVVYNGYGTGTDLIVNENGQITSSTAIAQVTQYFKDITAFAVYFTEFSLFLKQSFDFIPTIIWITIETTFGLSLVFLVWRFVIR